MDYEASARERTNVAANKPSQEFIMKLFAHSGAQPQPHLPHTSVCVCELQIDKPRQQDSQPIGVTETSEGIDPCASPAHACCGILMRTEANDLHASALP